MTRRPILLMCLFVTNSYAATVGLSSSGYTIEQIGMTDSEHTRDTDGYRGSFANYSNQAGHVVGYAYRYSAGGASLGQSAWLYNGSSAVNVGLTTSEYTRVTNGYRYNEAFNFNQAGQVAGRATRFGAGGAYLGQSTWVYNGSNTVNVGLTDSEHTRDTDGYRYSDTDSNSDPEDKENFFNEAGQAAGIASRYGSGGISLGQSTWVYNGTNTVRVGLIDSEHTRNTDGYRTSDVDYFNETGQAAGAARQWGAGGNALGYSAWVYNGNSTVKVGFSDSMHTRDTDGYRYSHTSNFNDAGHAAGLSFRYGASGTDLGRSAWLYNGTNTVNVGLTDSEHTRDTDGYQFGEVKDLNEVGQAAGASFRYGAGGSSIGLSAWVYNGSSTVEVGLIDSEHTSNIDGTRRNSVAILNEAGHVAGTAYRFGADGAYNGSSAWVYNGNSTAKVGLYDSEHTSPTNGHRFNEVHRLNEAGQAAGRSDRWGADGAQLGNSAWVYDGSSVVEVGLTDSEHTATSGWRSSYVGIFNELGQATGISSRYGVGGYLGVDAWFYDGDTSISLAGLSESSSGFASSYAQFLSDDGFVLGTYQLYDESDAYVNAVFGYSEETGLFDLGLAVDESFQDWSYLSSVLSFTDSGVIIGNGVLDDIGGSNMAYKLTPATAVPIPAAVYLFGSGLGLLGWFRRRQTA